MKEISIFCSGCKKSLGITVAISGNPDNPFLQGVTLRCTRCKRIATLKKFKEGSVVARMTKDFKFYV